MYLGSFTDRFVRFMSSYDSKRPGPFPYIKFNPGAKRPNVKFTVYDAFSSIITLAHKDRC